MLSSSPYKRPVSVLVVIHTPDHQVLLLERTGYPGYWQSVTGSQEGEETLIQTAYREVAEETGLVVGRVGGVGVVGPGEIIPWHEQSEYEIFATWRHRYAPGVTHNTEHRFSLCLPTPCPVTLSPREHRAWRWLPWREAAAACFSPSNREAILSLPSRFAN